MFGIGLFNEFLNLKRCGIFALVNNEDKKVYITFSKEICSSFARIIREIHEKTCSYKQLIDDAQKLSYIFIENINYEDTKLDIHLKMEYFIQQYKHLGYTMYNDKHKPAKFKVVIDVHNDIKRIHVCLMSKSYRRSITVGVFDKMWDAEEFAVLFDSMDIIIPVYSSNKLTREYYENQQKINLLPVIT
jgi:hypothetical protein